MYKSKFSEWLYGCGKRYKGKKFNIQDIDYVIYSPGENWYITIEEKAGGKENNKGGWGNWSQNKGQVFVIESMARASEKRESGDPVYKGHFLILFEKNDPNDSAWYKINGQEFKDKGEDLKYLLKYGKLPDF